MTDVVTFSTEQFEALIKAISKKTVSSEPATGLGALAEGLGKPQALGLGCGDGGMGPLASGVWAMIAGGSPRLALAKALGVPIAPYLINVRGSFPDTNTPEIPIEGADVPIVPQDCLVDSLIVRLTNQGATANQNQFQSQSDFYFNFQSGIEATLSVEGAPRYEVAPKFVPLSTLADMVNGNSHWPGGWILTRQQQLAMSFRTTVTLPDAPYDVCCTFRTWCPTGDAFVEMSNREAMDRLEKECGFVIDQSYKQRILSVCR